MTHSCSKKGVKEAESSYHTLVQAQKASGKKKLTPREEFATTQFRLAHDEWLNIELDTGFCDPGGCDLAPLYQEWLSQHADPNGTELEAAAYWERIAVYEGGGVREDWVADTIIATVATAGLSGLAKGFVAKLIRVGASTRTATAIDAAIEGAPVEASLMGRIPLGFESGEQFDSAVAAIRSAAGVDDAVIGVRGSAATGISRSRGVVGPDIGDIDVFVVSDTLYAQGVAAGARGTNGALRVGATQRFFPLHCIG